MSDINPLDKFRERCNEMCNNIWKYMDGLSEHIDKIPEGASREYLKQYKSTLGYMAELYFFNAVSLGQIRTMESGVINALFKEVFKDRTIQLPYKPEETLHDVVKRYKEKEPTLDWLDKDLKNKAKDVEK